MFLEDAAKQELHLGIDAPHVVVGPTAEGREDLRIDPEEKGIAERHGWGISLGQIDPPSGQL